MRGMRVDKVDPAVVGTKGNITWCAPHRLNDVRSFIFRRRYTSPRHWCLAGPGRNMAGLPNPLDPKYAPGAEQARQNVMIGVSVTMTLIGGMGKRL